jgi:acyl-CoA synthetase (NDP forming)
MLEAASIAVVGASPNASRPGARCLANLSKFAYRGRVYPVNGKYSEVLGRPCYADLASLPESPELVIVSVPARSVVQTVREAVAVQARSAVIFSSGFADAGADGKLMQAELARYAREADMTVLGPNTSGLADLRTGVVATFTSALDEDIEFKPGPVAIVSQSGAVSAALFGRIQQEGLGCAAFVGTGNEATTNVADYVRYYAGREDIAAIVGYMEGVTNGPALLRACQTATGNGKLVIMLKVGDTRSGRRMAQAHTSVLAPDRAVFEAAMRDAGVLVVRDLGELVDLAIGVCAEYRRSGPRIGIVSMSGGAAVMMSDKSEEQALELPEFAPGTAARLKEILPAFATRGNPVDYGALAGSPDQIVACIRAVADDPSVDQVLVSIGTSPFLRGFIETELDDIRRASGKPVIVSWIGGPIGAVASLRRHHVPAYDDPYRATAYAAAQAIAPPPSRCDESPAPVPAAISARSALRAHRTRSEGTVPSLPLVDLLAAYGISHVPTRCARTAEEAAEFAAQWPGPVAVKADAPGLIHKSDVGAVAVNVAPAAVTSAFDQVVTAARTHGFAPAGVLVQPMVEAGAEMIIGVHQDPAFGPVVLAGFGGVNAELFNDVAIGLPGLSAADGLSMIRRLRGYPLLDGFRGGQKADVGSVADLLERVGRLAADCVGELEDLDLNPVAVHQPGQGYTVLDAKATLRGTNAT